MTTIQTTLDLPFQEAEVKVRAALGQQGFGVLTEIDVAATLHEKLGVSRAPLKILGACNPDFANRALTIDPAVSLVLPCNVVLETVGSTTRVQIADPRDLMPGGELTDLVEEAAGQLEAVIETLENG
jgi:uncharacterized protein (DUF302 family)